MSKPTMVQRRTVLKGACALSAMPMLALPALAEQATTLCGRLLDPQGQAIAWATIDFPNQLQARTDADGRFYVNTPTAWPAQFTLFVQGARAPTPQPVTARLSPAHGDLRWLEMPAQGLLL